MAHLQSSAAIFSPSVARIAATTARDWNYIDTWLNSCFKGRTLSFERNPETLKALLLLAALNESADESKDHVSRTEAAALHLRPGGAATPDSVAPLEDALIGRIGENLTREGKIALESMASLAQEVPACLPEPHQLGHSIAELQVLASTLEQMSARVHALRKLLSDELPLMKQLLHDLRDDSYRPPPDLAKQNLDTQRRVKALSTLAPDTPKRISPSVHSHLATRAQTPTIERIAEIEVKYVSLCQLQTELDAQLEPFHGLPSETELAREELESLRGALRSIIQKRDLTFEGFVERDSPRKQNQY